MVSRRCPYWKWLEMSDLIISFQNEWNRWDLNELKWIEVNRGEMSDLMEMTWNNPMEVTWVNLMGKSLWFENECPYRFDLIDLSEKALCSVEWMSLWEWLGTTLWESPYGRLRVSLSKWLEWTLWECPYQNEWNRWEMNELKWIEVNRGKMSDLMDLTWNNPMRKSLWSIEGVPIKMTWMNPMRMSLSKWSDLIELKWIERFEVIWVNWRKWARTTLWESPYGQKKVSLWEWLDVSENESPYQNDQNRWDLN